MQQQWTISLLDCDMWWESGFYAIISDGQLSAWTKKTFQSISQRQTCTRKRSWPLVVRFWSDPLQFSVPVKPLHLRSMLSKLMGYTENCNTGIGQQNGPNSSPCQCLTVCHTTNASKVEQIGLWSFASSAILTWPLTNILPLPEADRQLFTGKMLQQPAEGRKCFLRVCWILKLRVLHCRNKQTYFLLAKSVDCNGSYFDE